MHIDGSLIPIFAIAVGFVITITAILTDHITRYKLKVEQIRADAMVRTEEVRSRNQLELEKLMRDEQDVVNRNNEDPERRNQPVEEGRATKSRVRE